MSLKISQPHYGQFHSFSKLTPCQHFGTFIGFQVRPACTFCTMKLSNFNACPFTPGKISQRQAHVVDIRSLLLVLVLKAVHEQTMNNGCQFKSGSTKPNHQHQHSFREQYRDNTHSQQRSHRSEHQKTSGGQRDNGPEAPDVARPDMVKVNESFNNLGLRGNSLESITKSQVGKAFRNKSRIYHPDMVRLEDKAEEAKKKKENEEIFKKLTEYRECLEKFIEFRDSRR